ncbi:MAG: 1-acyl-sn-glycerol-3-phosphate acyltransferase [Actinobacteria bacterium]|nr:1-acyl-sn-glycerol-3-phosphate acyltransferase [Actinomycetota bacterium]
MFYKLTCTLLVLIFKLLFRYEITGRQHIPREGSVILAANHMSYLDPIMIAFVSGSRPVNFMAKAELLKIPVFGWILRKLNTFPIKRGLADKGAIAYVLRILSRGEVLLIFPEGTRYRNGELGQAHPGVASIALKTGTPIVPVGIIGTDQVMPNGSRLPRPVKLRARIGQPITVDKADAGERKEKEIELTERIMKEISNLIAGD